MSSEAEKRKEFEALFGPSEELLIHSGPAFDILADFSFILDCGKKALIHNMKYCKDTLKLPAFDPDNPYKDYDSKNKYFVASNRICYKSLWLRGLYAFAENYFRIMLGEIRKFEEKHTHNHNKGMVYANLGISQAIQHKIDEGFANILKALDEDRGYLGPGKKPTSEFFNSRLFRQTERILVVQSLEPQINELKKEGETCPATYDFLNGLVDPDQRIFFEYTYVKIQDNYGVWKEKPNRFSANRMIAYLQDMCLFAEDFLKRKGHKGMLNELIVSAFLGVNLRGCSANSYKQLNDKLKQYYKQANKRDRALRMLLTLRNFTSHNISAGEPSDFVLKHFDNVFNEILRAVIYVCQLP